MKTLRVIPFTLSFLLISVLPIQYSQAQGKYQANVKRVVDGDTIVLEGGERVRYIGINTPETKHPRKPVECYGRQAYQANRSLVEGKTLRLEFDVQKRDRYGRLLAYVYLPDGTFVNAWLLQNGYAQVMTIPPNVKYQELLLRHQREARGDGRGLWAKCRTRS